MPFQNDILAGTAGAGGEGGTLWSWGDGVSGGLGDGQTSHRCSPAQVGSETYWFRICNSEHLSVALTTDSELFTWGHSANGGGLGDGTTTNRCSPAQIGSDTDWSTEPGHLDCGRMHVVVIKTDGTLWCWGLNDFGQLGDGSKTYRSSPAQLGTLTNWAGHVGTHYRGCAVIKADGTLWTWGRNDKGQLGDGTTSSRCSPAQIGSDTDWSNIGEHEKGYTAIKTDGTLWGWGEGEEGNMGDGTNINRSSPIQIGTLTNWAGPAVGSDVATHCVKTDGTLWGWGRPPMGGWNSNTPYSSPIQVGTLTNWNSEDADPQKSLAGGSLVRHALKTDGTIWGWGEQGGTYTQYGTIGDGSNIDRSSPVQIGSLTTWTDISASAHSRHILAIQKP